MMYSSCLPAAAVKMLLNLSPGCWLRCVKTAGDLTLDRGHCMLRTQTGEVRLSGKEMQILELFLLHPGQVLPRATLQHKVWGPDNEFAYNNIEVYLSLVRRKLRAIGSTVQIHAERGMGYYMDA